MFCLNVNIKACYVHCGPILRKIKMCPSRCFIWGEKKLCLSLPRSHGVAYRVYGILGLKRVHKSWVDVEKMNPKTTGGGNVQKLC